MASSFAEDPRDRAFERLYERYVRDVYRYVLAVMRNPAEAEDVTQTTFLNAYRALQAGEEPQKPHNWLITIAHNVCRSRMRFSMRRPKEVPLDVVVEQLEVPEAERPNVRELLRVLGRLPFNQRAALTMRELEGRSYVEIAETLGVTVPAAEALIGRARRTVRSQESAIRGLGALPLPAALRNLLSRGDAAGGAAGSAAIAKVAALLVAGAVVGGVGGLVQRGDAQSGPSEPVAQLDPVRHAPATAPHRHSRQAAPVAVVVSSSVGTRKRHEFQPGETGHARFDTSDEAAAAGAVQAVAAAPASHDSAAGAPTAARPEGPVRTTSAPVRTASAPVRSAVAPVTTVVKTATQPVKTATEPVKDAVQTATTAVTAPTVSVQPPPVPTAPSAPAAPQPPAVPPISIP